MKDDHFSSIFDFLLIYFTLEPKVDLYADKNLWEAILYRVERWDTSKTDPTASFALHRAGQLLHKTENGQFFL